MTLIEAIFFGVLGFVLGVIYVAYLRRDKAASVSETKETTVQTATGGVPSTLTDLYDIAETLDDFFNRTAHPRDLLQHADFLKGVDLVEKSSFTSGELIGYGAGDNVAIACMAFEGLYKRNEEADPTDDVIAAMPNVYLWPLFFAFRCLRPSPEKSLIGAVLSKTRGWWVENAYLHTILTEFIETCLKQGEQPSFNDALESVDGERLEHIEEMINRLKMAALEPVVEELHEWQKTRVDVSALRALGRVWAADDPNEVIIEHPALDRVLREIESTFTQTPRRSVVLVGETGVGKTTSYTMLARQLQRKGWIIFEAGTTDILAGQIYLGQLEERVQTLVANLSGNRKAVWIVPNVHELMFAGWHRNHPRSVLDMLMPHLEAGELTILGETEPEAFERLLQLKPQLRAVIHNIELEALDSEETMALARSWSRALHKRNQSVPIGEDVLDEAFQLARQFLDKSATPGNLIDFLKLAERSKPADDQPLVISDLFRSLTQLTGLPASILDARQGLDVRELRSLFQRRVLGQPEAVDCLVERVAMIKAGLNDPSRPAGVFLFVGPTGTGKTEIAKTLAEFLFGSADRMIRLDMSEFMSEDSLNRLLGDGDRASESKALVNLIRKQPFSVILLDEFEKAHPNVWDLFLQVFDDGRLTDRRGTTADFRHSIIILTSNLGAAIPRGSQVGFSGEKQVFSETNVTKAVGQTFRPEFLNRIDRVVVFRPLSRGVVRDILLKELGDVLQRRGFRTREWAVEWEDSALDFLLDKGFTAELGARPLKRAIERYLLSPLAITIVQNQFPEGDQFLFVRSKGHELDVEFIDPDATEGPDEFEASDIEKGPDAVQSLKPIILDPMGAPAEVDQLQAIYSMLNHEVISEDWQDRKAESLAMTSSPEFWESEARFEVLGEIEYMDRLERALDTATSLFQRLKGEEDSARTSYSKVLVQRLANRLYLLENAFEGEEESLPRDAFIAIEPGSDGVRNEEVQQFAYRLSKMYTNWAVKRQMRHKILIEERVDGERLKRFVLAVAGLGAYAILSREAGIHVWEIPGEKGKTFRRLKVHVRVASQPVVPGDTTELLKNQAEANIKSAEAVRTVVRRYRKDPSPLVRDSVQGWRTGKLDRVLEGDFDLISE